MDNHLDDAISHMYDPVEQLLPARPTTDDVADDIRGVLTFLGHVAHRAGPEAITKALSYLTRRPGELACVIAEGSRHETNELIRDRLLGMACAVNVELATAIAADRLTVNADDPRYLPALRHDALTWWQRIIETTHHPHIQGALSRATAICAEPGATLMRTLARETYSDTDIFANLSTEDSVTGVIQVVAALSLASNDPPTAATYSHRRGGVAVRVDDELDPQLVYARVQILRGQGLPPQPARSLETNRTYHRCAASVRQR